MVEAPPALVPPTNPVLLSPVAASYVGTSPIPPPTDNSMTVHWLGPQMSLHDTMAHAAGERPISWVRGMRTAAGAWLMVETPVGTFPMTSDLRAARLLHFLAPVQRDAMHCEAWMLSVLRGFSVWGLFERHVQLGGWVAGSHPLEHYPFKAMNITYSQSMQWVHAHGVDRAWTAAQELHVRHILRFSGNNIETTESMLHWDEGCITAWATLWHGPLHPGTMSATPGGRSGTARRRGHGDDASRDGWERTEPQRGLAVSEQAPSRPHRRPRTR
ncbi:hypothetical protein K438DRAFT_1786667 [Mycena galopus ATCC 62051]|nr:hypothetical protein K438DRAFT_1786667 [Mycena galopus ATCC 62051]